MKRFISLLIAVCLTGTIIVGAQQQNTYTENPNIYLDENEVTFNSSAPYIENGITMVPLRAFDNMMGHSVEWKEPNAELKYGESTALFMDGDIYSVVEGDMVIPMQTAAKEINGVMYVPLRFLCELVGAEVYYQSGTVYINRAHFEAEPTAIPVENDDKDYGRYNFDVSMARLIKSSTDESKNYMFSPISVKMALAMAANGADGETKQEMLNVLGIESLNEYNETVKAYLERVKQNSEYNAQIKKDENGNVYEKDKFELDIANSIWLNDDYYADTDDGFSDEFKNTVINYYNGEARGVKKDNAVKTINSWISDSTRGKIDNVLDSSDFWSAIVNAVYMKAAWQSEFNENATQTEPFTVKAGTEKDVEMMHKTDDMPYYSDGKISAVRLRYLGGASMYVVLGENESEPHTVLKHLNDFKNAYINLSMPRFKTEYDTKLNDMLKILGMKKAFSKQEAKFTKMVENVPEPLYISDVIHKTFINVDERGTEAAAVTVIVMSGAGMPAEKPEPIEFKVNRSFNYYIVDDESEDVLFMGAYNGD